MNLIDINIEKTRTVNDKGQELYDIDEYRRIDYKKIEKTIYSLWKKLKELNPQFEYEITKNRISSAYSGFGQDYQIQYTISQAYMGAENVVKLNIPELVHNSYFILANSYYIPTMVLERLPIDKNSSDNKTYITLNYGNSFVIHKPKGSKKKAHNLIITTPKNKNIQMEYFFSTLMVDRQDLLEEIKDHGWINKIHKYNKYLKDSCKALGLFNYDYFKTSGLFLSDFMNEYYLTDFHKNLFKEIYGIDTFEEIFFNALGLYSNPEIKIDLSNLENRRLVMSEYLLTPIFDLYYRLLNILTDKVGSKQLIMPSANSAVVISNGFRNLMHGKQLYDISSPYATALKYKMSQKLPIIKDKVPSAWTELHKTHFRNVDPIAVSAGDMGGVIVGTRLTRVNKQGIFEVDDKSHNFNYVLKTKEEN